MITRRDLLKLSGLTLSVMLMPEGYRILKAQEVPRRYAPNLWINLSRDNYLTVLVNKSEMGQGVYTGLAMLVAEELDFPWERVRVRPAPAGRAYVDPKMGIQLTGGSTSVRNMYETLRLAGASMREMLIASASKRLKVPADKIRAERGYLLVEDKRYAYGEFVDLASKEQIPAKPRLKESKEFIYIGRSVPRVDAPEKVDGKAVFGIDTFEEGMVYAIVERPPYFGAKALKVDSTEAKRVPEVVDIFPISTGVAICGESLWACQKARRSLKIEWSESFVKGWEDKDLEKYFLQKLRERGDVVRVKGSPQRVFEGSPVKVEETYIQPYLYHATMEPMACLAWVKKDECIVYAPTQSQTWVLESAKRVSGLPEGKIKVITTYLGGGFGRKANVEFVAEALEISKRLSKPVKLIYTREDDISSGYYRPYSATHIKVSADQRGNIDSLSFKIAVQPLLGGRASVEGVENTPYNIPNLYVERVDVELPISVWFWRSVGSTHNAFSLETILDRIAYQTKQDPGELRLKLLRDNPVAYRVVQTAMERSGWGRKKNLGIAYHYSFGSHACHVAEVELDTKSGQVKVKRVMAVIDVGPVIVHPDLIRSQVEGSVVMGLSMALKEKVSFKGGGVENSNFGSYGLLTMDETPEIEVHILTSNRQRGGVGEPGLPPTAPAVANALLWGYGIRVNRLPMTPEYIKSLL